MVSESVKCAIWRLSGRSHLLHHLFVRFCLVIRCRLYAKVTSEAFTCQQFFKLWRSYNRLNHQTCHRTPHSQDSFTRSRSTNGCLESRPSLGAAGGFIHSLSVTILHSLEPSFISSPSTFFKHFSLSRFYPSISCEACHLFLSLKLRHITSLRSVHYLSASRVLPIVERILISVKKYIGFLKIKHIYIHEFPARFDGVV